MVEGGGILNMLEYKGYKTNGVVFNNITRMYHGNVCNIKKNSIDFQCMSPENAKQEFEHSVDTYLRFCKNMNKYPEIPGRA